MIHIENRKLFQNAIAKWGFDAQLLMVIEENTELIEQLNKINKDICHYKRNRAINKEGLTEEIADVLIMLEQLKMMMQIDDFQLQNFIDAKIERIKAKIK